MKRKKTWIEEEKGALGIIKNIKDTEDEGKEGQNWVIPDLVRVMKGVEEDQEEKEDTINKEGHIMTVDQIPLL